MVVLLSVVAAPTATSLPVAWACADACSTLSWVATWALAGGAAVSAEAGWACRVPAAAIRTLSAADALRTRRVSRRPGVRRTQFDHFRSGAHRILADGLGAEQALLGHRHARPCQRGARCPELSDSLVDRDRIETGTVSSV
ncbi:hypothetical protein GXW82_11975 [Streptacidiphilus sp. 4-A2]|nr:hypothetical protein [Streptacidiphilus sp. 4-A2]